MQVGVDRDQYLAGCVIDPGHQGGGLPVIASQIDDLDVRVFLGNLTQLANRPVRAAVIDENDLVGQAETGEDVCQRLADRSNISFFIVNRDDDGQALDGLRALGPFGSALEVGKGPDFH